MLDVVVDHSNESNIAHNHLHRVPTRAPKDARQRRARSSVTTRSTTKHIGFRICLIAYFEIHILASSRWTANHTQSNSNLSKIVVQTRNKQPIKKPESITGFEPISFGGTSVGATAAPCFSGRRSSIVVNENKLSSWETDRETLSQTTLSWTPIKFRWYQS